VTLALVTAPPSTLFQWRERTLPSSPSHERRINHAKRIMRTVTARSNGAPSSPAPSSPLLEIGVYSAVQDLEIEPTSILDQINK
jgi:hypothetical protein